jgi:hypothetical protein
LTAAARFIEAREPWDDTAYWAVVYPLALILSAVLGLLYRDRSWRWALTIFWAQNVAMWILGGELGNLWPLTLVISAIIAIPAMLLATRPRVSASLRKRIATSIDSDPLLL